MSIASDRRYRSVAISFVNNDQSGSELVQLLAKPAAGSWAVQRTFPVSPGVDQQTTWDTALPLTLYDIALRYMQGSTAAVGYESSDPDAWTAATAAGSKGTVTTSCALVTGLAGSSFVNSSTPITLTWSCDQQGVAFLIEKNAGAGWVTVVADLVATSYNYTIPGAELGGTTQFRVTPKNGSIAGTTSDAISVLMSIVVGATTWSSATFSATTRIASLAWTAATSASNYLLEKSLDAGANYSTIGTISGLTYEYPVPDAEINTTVRFRVRGQNGAVQGATATTNLAMTIVVGTSVLSLSVAFNPITGTVSFSWTAATNATAYRLQMDTGSGYGTIGESSELTRQVQASQLSAYINTTPNFRVLPINQSVLGTASNVVAVALTVNVPNAPSGVTATHYDGNPNYGPVVSWSVSTGDVSSYSVYGRTAVGNPWSSLGSVAPNVFTLSRPEVLGIYDVYVESRTMGDRVIGGASSVVVVT